MRGIRLVSALFFIDVFVLARLTPVEETGNEQLPGALDFAIVDVASLREIDMENCKVALAAFDEQNENCFQDVHSDGMDNMVKSFQKEKANKIPILQTIAADVRTLKDKEAQLLNLLKGLSGDETDMDMKTEVTLTGRSSINAVRAILSIAGHILTLVQNLINLIFGNA